MEEIPQAHSRPELPAQRVVDSISCEDTGEILYDVQQLSTDWEEDSPTRMLEFSSTPVYSFMQGFHVFRFLVVLFYYYRSSLWLSSSKENSKVLDIPWRFSISLSCTQIALLQRTTITFYHIHDDHIEPIRSVSVPEMGNIETTHLHQHPEQYRKVEWSHNEQLVAVLAGCTGPIILLSLQKDVQTKRLNLEDFNIRNGVASLCFRDQKANSQLWELLILGMDGFLVRVQISKDLTATQAFHEGGTLFAGKLHANCTSMAYDSKSQLLFIGGGRKKKTNIQPPPTLSVWELLDDSPYHTLIHSTYHRSKKVNSSKKQGSMWRIMKHLYTSVTSCSAISKICFSESRTLCAGLDDIGNITIWNTKKLEEEPKVLQAADLIKHHRSASWVTTSHEIRLIQDISWWSDTAMAILWGNGEVTVTDINNFSNLLGSFAESLAPRSQLSSCIFRSRIIALEWYHCESVRANGVGVEGMGEEEGALPLSDLLGEALDFLNESNPSDIEERLGYYNHNKLRLTQLKAATPLEFIRRRIHLNLFDEALLIADHYQIHRDVVYQCKWPIVPEISVASIHKYLEPVTDRIWVLDQCVHQPSRSLPETILMFIYGIYQTVPASCYKKIPFANWNLLDLTNFTLLFDSLILVDSPECEDEENILYSYRLILLHYLDRLAAYEEIQNGPRGSQTHIFIPKEFDGFKNCSFESESIALAKSANFSALERIFALSTRFNASTSRCSVLEHINTTVDPILYKKLLPRPNQEFAIFWRHLDWFEGKAARPDVLASLVDNVHADKIEQLDILCSKPFMMGDGGNEELVAWYISFAELIDRESGFSSHAEAVLSYGCEHESLSNLRSFYERFKSYTFIVYQGDLSVDWNSFENCSSYDLLCKLLSSSTYYTMAFDVHDRGTSLIQQANQEISTELITKETDITQWILVRYILDNTQQKELRRCVPIIQSLVDPACPLLGTPESLIPSEVLFLRMVLECVYSPQAVGKWTAMNEIYQCVPERDATEPDEYYQQLHDEIDAFEIHLQASELLSQYHISIPLSAYKNLNPNSAAQLIQKICAQAGKTKETLSDKEWLDILSVILDLREKIFEFISVDFCYSCFCEALLFQSKFQLAKEYLVKSEKADKILIKAAKEFFNAAVNSQDENFKNAKVCLTMFPSVIKSSDAGVNEWRLFRATKLLLTKLYCKKIPIQIRLADKKILLQEVIETQPQAYKHSKVLLEISHLFDRDGKSKKKDNLLLTTCAMAALSQEDYLFSKEIISTLISKNASVVWECALRLGLVPSDCSTLSNDERIHLLEFSLCYCSPEHISECLSTLDSIQAYSPFSPDGNQSHALSLFTQSFELYKAGDILSATSFSYQALSNLSELDSFQSALFKMLSLHEHEENMKTAAAPKEFQHYLSILCFNLSAHHLLQGKENNLISLLKDSDFHSIIQQATGKEKATKEHAPYLYFFQRVFPFLEEAEEEKVFFRRTLVPASFPLVETTTTFFGTLLDDASSVEDMNLLVEIIQRWEKNAAVHAPLHDCWMLLVLHFIKNNEFEHVKTFLGEHQALFSEDEEISLLASFAEYGSSYWKHKIGLYSSRDSVREVCLNELVAALKSEKAKIAPLCDSAMVSVLLEYKIDNLCDIIKSPSFYEGLVDLLGESTKWTSPIPSLRALSYPTNGKAHFSLPFLIGVLLEEEELITEAYSILMDILKLPYSFRTWSNGIFTLVQFLEQHQHAQWTQEVRERSQHFTESDDWERSVFLCQKSLATLQ